MDIWAIQEEAMKPLIASEYTSTKHTEHTTDNYNYSHSKNCPNVLPFWKE